MALVLPRLQQAEARAQGTSSVFASFRTGGRSGSHCTLSHKLWPRRHRANQRGECTSCRSIRQARNKPNRPDDRTIALKQAIELIVSCIYSLARRRTHGTLTMNASLPRCSRRSSTRSMTSRKQRYLTTCPFQHTARCLSLCRLQSSQVESRKRKGQSRSWSSRKNRTRPAGPLVRTVMATGEIPRIPRRSSERMVSSRTQARTTIPKMNSMTQKIFTRWTPSKTGLWPWKKR